MSNPLNSVKPLIVNLYFKKDVPPLGYYDPIYPETIEQRLKDPLKFSYKHVIDSHNKTRDVTDSLLCGDKSIIELGKVPLVYDVERGYKALNKVKESMPSSIF